MGNYAVFYAKLVLVSGDSMNHMLNNQTTISTTYVICTITQCLQLCK